MSKRRPMIAVFAGFALLPALFAGSGCGTSSRMSEEAFSSYEQSFTPDSARPIGNAIEVTAPKMAHADARTLQLSGAGESRQVRARMISPAEWVDVRAVYLNAETPNPALTDAQVRDAFERGVVARSGELRLVDDGHLLSLTDVDLGEGASAPLAQVTIKFAPTSGSRAAVAMNPGLGTGAGVTTIRIGGD